MTNRIVPAVRKHIVPQEALAGAGVAVGVEEAAKGGVVISGLQVVEARFPVEIITPVAQRIDLADQLLQLRAGAAAGEGDQIAVGIVVVLGNEDRGGVQNADHVALQVGHVIETLVRRAAGDKDHVRIARVVIEEIHGAGLVHSVLGLRPFFPQQLAGGVEIIVPDAVHDFIGPQAVHVVVIAERVGAVGRRRQLTAVLPAHGPGAQITGAEIARRVAVGVVGVASAGGDAAAGDAEAGEFILPVGISVGIGQGLLGDAAFRIASGFEIAEVVVAVVPGLGAAVLGLLFTLSL